MPYNNTYQENILHFTIEPIEEKYHSEIYNEIVKDFTNQKFTYAGGKNILLNIDNPIYSNFCTQIYTIFKDLTNAKITKKISKESSNNCWANITNTNFFLGNIHDHSNTAHVNCVYYFNIPDGNGGELDFFDDNNNNMFTFLPKQGDMIIFPGNLKHKNRYIDSDKFRISINMELLLEENYV
jgi:hypothetical protein